MIQTRALVKRYGKVDAVSGIDLNIREGEIYGFLGPNGAGKTTTIMMLLGMLRPTSGEIRMFDQPYGPGRLDLRRRIGMVPEKHPRGAWPWITAGEYLKFFAELYRIEKPLERIRHLIEKVELSGAIDKKIRTYSRGMLQKLSIIRALLPDPDILLLDEPISGLDPIGIMQVRDLIAAENREGRTVFISSHQLSEMEKICHRVGIISSGRLLVEDSMRSLLSRLTKEREILVGLDHIPQGLVQRIQAIPSVLACSVEGTSLIIKVPKEGDFLRLVVEMVISQNVIPRRIQEKVLTLEEAFFNITTENVAGLVMGGEKR
jgi:ABC-type multidrug transport system ATPase subunit